MDATPSPQSVGREFVRQYYTLLNKAPDHLHRFYNNNSSFVHGGLEAHNREAMLVVGQKQIYNKIQQLNFRDCHAKISQVDAQSTLGNGVVVQVTGELSSNGQPMRRFTQTFVLAAQAPKKYYVHNDIFRYQDLYADDEADGESRSENDEEQDGENSVVVVENNLQNNQMTQIPQQIYYPVSVPAAGQNVAIQAFPQSPQMNGGGVHDDLSQQQQQASPPNAQAGAGTVVSATTVSSSSQPMTIPANETIATVPVTMTNNTTLLQSAAGVIPVNNAIDNSEPSKAEVLAAVRAAHALSQPSGTASADSNGMIYSNDNSPVKLEQEPIEDVSPVIEQIAEPLQEESEYTLFFFCST